MYCGEEIAEERRRAGREDWTADLQELLPCHCSSRRAGGLRELQGSRARDHKEGEPELWKLGALRSVLLRFEVPSGWESKAEKRFGASNDSDAG